MSVTPLNDRILVQRIDGEQKSAGGIIIPDSAKEKPLEGRVVSVGPGKWDKGERRPLDVSAGDRILFGKYGGIVYNLETGGQTQFQRDEGIYTMEFWVQPPGFTRQGW